MASKFKEKLEWFRDERNPSKNLVKFRISNALVDAKQVYPKDIELVTQMIADSCVDWPMCSKQKFFKSLVKHWYFAMEVQTHN